MGIKMIRVFWTREDEMLFQEVWRARGLEAISFLPKRDGAIAVYKKLPAEYRETPRSSPHSMLLIDFSRRPRITWVKSNNSKRIDADLSDAIILSRSEFRDVIVHGGLCLDSRLQSKPLYLSNLMHDFRKWFRKHWVRIPNCGYYCGPSALKIALSGKPLMAFGGLYKVEKNSRDQFRFKCEGWPPKDFSEEDDFESPIRLAEEMALKKK